MTSWEMATKFHIILVGLVGLAHILISPVDSKWNPKLSKHSVVIVISFDGLRHDFVYPPFHTPNIRKFRNSGVYAPHLRCQFPTYTYPNHQTMATGLYPSYHGIVHNSFFDPRYEKALNASDAEFWNYREDVVPLWITNELTGGGRYSAAIGWPGAEFGYGPHNSTPTHLLIQREPPDAPTTIMDNIISYITDSTRPANLVFADLPEPDHTEHEFGPNSMETRMAVKAVDDAFGYLVEKLQALRIYNEVNLIIVSDHGFSEFTQNQIINLTAFADRSKYEVYSSSPAKFISPHKGEFRNVYKALKRAALGNHFRVFKSHTPNPFWSVHRLCRRFSPIVALADEGFAFDDAMKYVDHFNLLENKTSPKDRTYGKHGYDNRLRNMGAVFIARGPGFQNGGKETSPFENVDIYPLICHLLSISCNPNNGTIGHMLDILQRSSAFYTH